MNTGVFICIIFGALFAILAILFALLKERATMLISGFNTLPKEDRDKYDKARLSMDRRNAFFIWTVIFALGAIASFFISSYAVVIAIIVWLILFFRDLHLDAEKAFKKFKV
jgi:hypothetical protein